MIIEQNAEKLLLEIGFLFHKRGKEIYAVGGCVRDFILGRTPKDIDFATSASAADIPKIVKPAAKWVYDKSPAKGYGTHGVLLKSGTEVEITPFRRNDEIFGTGEVVSLEMDLRTRDFTVNAIAMDVSPDSFARIIDLFDGQKDLADKILRTPAPPATTFRDDPLRILRAARFCAEFDFSPEHSLLEALTEIASLPEHTGRVALERVREELVKMLEQQSPSKGIRLMHEWGLILLWLPEVAALSDMKPEPGAHHKNAFNHTLEVLDKASAIGPHDACFRFAVLLHDIGKPATRKLDGGEYSFDGHEKTGAELAKSVCKRLRWSNADSKRIVEIVALHHRLNGYSPEWTDSAVRRAVHDLGVRYDDVMALSRADITSSLPEKVEELKRLAGHFENRVSQLDREQLTNPQPPLNGKEIMDALGISPGPIVGRVVEHLKELIVAGELAPEDKTGALEIVKNGNWE